MDSVLQSKNPAERVLSALKIRLPICRLSYSNAGPLVGPDRAPETIRPCYDR
jgi:hypothetical protein